MAGVNLLPAELRTGRGARRSLAFPLIFLLVASLLTGAHLRLVGVLHQQEETEAELTEAIEALEQVRVRRELMVRLQQELAAVENEFARRAMWSEYVDEFTSRLPYGVVIQTIRMDGARITVTAKADTLSQVAQFITNVAASPSFKEPSVGQMSITEGRGTGRVDFGASVDIIPPKQRTQP